MTRVSDAEVAHADPSTARDPPGDCPHCGRPPQGHRGGDASELLAPPADTQRPKGNHPVSTYIDRASQLKKQYNARLEALRTRKDLSDEGRRRQIAKLKVDTQNEMRKLAQQNNDAIAQRKQRLLDRVFGNPSPLPSQVIAQRDAMDRAAKITTAEEAASALKLARFTGDHGLAKAVAMRAYDFTSGPSTISGEWAGVINAWAKDEAPPVDDALTELSALQQENSSHQSRLVRGMQFTVPDPPELTGKNTTHLAAQADPAHDTEPDQAAG